ncbi:MAG: hypothetical protein PHR68_00160 [Candidatus Gracilibacteria bacterium]|nr:hypothetical protein [Candidatus Gracilibacteria bacterium]
MSEIKNESPASSTEVKNIKKLDELNLKEVSNFLLERSPFDLKNNEDDRRIARKFLEEIAKESNNKNKIEDSDIPSIFNQSERKALIKVKEAVKLAYEINEIKENVVSCTKEELDVLQNFMEGKELVKQQTQEKVKTLEDNVTGTFAVKEKSKKERGELKLSQVEKDEKMAKLEYLGLTEEEVSDLNIDSAIEVLSSGQIGMDKETWENLGYKYDGFTFNDKELSQLNEFSSKINVAKLKKLKNLENQGISVLNLVNTKNTIKENNSNDVFKILCDINSDGKLDKDDNKAMISGIQVLDFIENNSKYEKQILTNIGNILGLSINTKEGLYNAIKTNPSLKYDFFNKLYFTHMAGISMSDYLINGKNGIKSNIESTSNFTDKLESGFTPKYEQALLDLENSLSKAKTEEEKTKINDLIKIYRENKQSFIDSFKFNGASLLISLVDNKKGIGAGGTFSNEKIDDLLKNKTSSIVEGMQLNLGFTNIGGKYVPGVGINFPSKNFNLSEDLKFKANAGLFLNVPYLTGTLNYNYNKDDIKNAGIKDFSDSKYVGITGNISTLANGLTLHWTKEKKDAIDKKEIEFSNILDELFENKLDVFLVKSLKFEDREYLASYASKIKDTLNLIGYNSFNDSQKKFVVQGLKYSILNKWKETIYNKAQDDGFNLTGIGLGVQFISGFFPIPTLGLRVSDYETKYSEDSHSKAINYMAGSKGSNSGKNENISGKELIDSMSEFKNEELDNYLKSNISKFDGSKDGYSPLAMRNPKDYPKFANALFAGDNDNAFNVLENILKTDPVLKKDSDIKKLLSKFKNVNPEQKAYILAQFEDVIFKDKNSIQEVLSDKKLWDSRESGLKNVYTNKEVYNEILKLRTETKNNIGTNQVKENVNDVMGFVASYKIGYNKDGKAHRLASGEAAIPAGLASSVGGEKGIISISNNDLLVNHTIDKMKSTLYYNELKKSISQVIGSSLDDSSFDSLLKTGTLNEGGKDIKLNRDFVFMLYGQCANETLGLRIKSIDLNGKSTDLVFSPNGEIVANKVIFDVNSYNIGFGGDGKKDKPKPKEETKPGHDAGQDPDAPTNPNTAPTTGPGTTNPNIDTSGTTTIPGTNNGTLTNGPTTAPVISGGTTGPSNPVSQTGTSTNTVSPTTPRTSQSGTRG